MASRVTHGADVELLDDAAIGLRRQGDRIGDVGGRGSALLEKLRAVWDGPDFEDFSREWRRAHRRIDDAEEAIRAYSKRLLVEADDQRLAAGGSLAGAGGGAPDLGDDLTTTKGEWLPAGEQVPGEQVPVTSQSWVAEVREAPQLGAVLATPQLIADLVREAVHAGLVGPIQIDELLLVEPDLSRAEVIGTESESETGLAFLRSDGTGPQHPGLPEQLSGTPHFMVRPDDAAPGIDPASATSSQAAGTPAAPTPAVQTPAAHATPASTPFAPAPTGDGTYVSTDPGSPGQRSVAIDPTLAASAAFGGMSDVASWLGLDEVDLDPQA